jgi:RecB family exonuclease
VRAIGGHVEVLRASRSWGGAAAALRASLTALLGSEESRVGWAGRAGESERLVLNVLEEIAALDRIEPYEGPGALAAALERALERDAPQVGRLGFGVVVGPLEHASGLALDAVIVLGCVEGDLPGRTAVSPLLSIADRDASGLESRSATASVGRDRRRLLLALGGANAAVASAPLADARTGRERMISRFLDGGPPVREVDSESGRLRELDTEEATAPIEVLLAGLLRGAGAHGSVGPLVEGNPGLARAVTRATSRRDEVCGPYDGAAEGTVALEIVAPTTIEQFAVCPFRFFVDHVLRAEVIDEPERRLSISPADRGLAMHEVLEAYVRQRIDGTLAQSDAERAGALVTIADRVFRRLERFGLTGKSILWEIERRRMLANLERERRLDEERLARSGAEPIAVELAFGREDVRGPTVAVLGRSIEFRGFIDRIDRRPDGGLEVIDYKSGSPRSYQRRGEDPVSRGRHLQLPVYALAAQSAFGGEATRATYRFIGDDPVEVDFRLDEAGAGHFSHALEVLVGAIDAGRFPYRPGEGDRANCRGCDFDVVCPSDRSERWVAERVDARSAAYVGLVAPHADRCPDLAVDAGEEES